MVGRWQKIRWKLHFIMKIIDSAKMLSFVSLLGSMLLAASGAVQAADGSKGSAFSKLVPDLPIMEGLQEVEDAGMAFDNPGGRIVETYAEGPVNSDVVKRFYQGTLPQLGWEDQGNGLYSRENEELRIDILHENANLLVRFTITPRT